MQEESRIQMAVLRWTQQAAVRRAYPCLKLMYHVPNERKCTPQQGRMMKLLGVKSGVPDLCLPVSSGGYHSLYIEMKTPKGRVSAEQEWWAAELRAQGHKVCVCRSLDEAVRALTEYLGGAENG